MSKTFSVTNGSAAKKPKPVLAMTNVVDLAKKAAERGKAVKKLPPSGLSSEVRSKLKKKMKKVKETKQKIASKIDLNKMVRAVEDGKLVINKRSLTNPKSDEDYRLIHIRKIGKLTSIAKNLEDEILGPESNNRLVYALSAVYQKIDESVDALRSLKTAEEKVATIGSRILEPSFRRMIGITTDLVTDFKKLLKANVKESDFKKLEERLMDMIKQRSADYQNIYDTTLEHVGTVVEEDL